MALPFTNGNIIANSFTANINGTVYVVNQATLDAPAESVVVTNENGSPTAAYHWKGNIRTGTAELQVNATAQQQSLQGETFITTAFTNSNVNLVITSQSMPVAKGTARVYNVGIAEVL